MFVELLVKLHMILGMLTMDEPDGAPEAKHQREAEQEREQPLPPHAKSPSTTNETLEGSLATPPASTTKIVNEPAAFADRRP